MNLCVCSNRVSGAVIVAFGAAAIATRVRWKLRRDRSAALMSSREAQVQSCMTDMLGGVEVGDILEDEVGAGGHGEDEVVLAAAVWVELHGRSASSGAGSFGLAAEKSGPLHRGRPDRFLTKTSRGGAGGSGDLGGA